MSISIFLILTYKYFNRNKVQKMLKAYINFGIIYKGNIKLPMKNYHIKRCDFKIKTAYLRMHFYGMALYLILWAKIFSKFHIYVYNPGLSMKSTIFFHIFVWRWLLKFCFIYITLKVNMYIMLIDACIFNIS